MFWTSRFFLAATFVVAIITLTHADQPQDKPAEETIDRESMTDLVVILRDADGEPVEGAAVMAYAMRMQECGGHGFWNSEKLGPPKSVMSNKKGNPDGIAGRYERLNHAVP